MTVGPGESDHAFRYLDVAGGSRYVRSTLVPEQPAPMLSAREATESVSRRMQH